FADLRALAAPVTPPAGEDPPSPEPDSTAADSIEAHAAAYWRAQDPDLTTDENEVELDFLARTANALLLFRDGDGVRWDLRAALFTRCGALASIVAPPLDSELMFHVERRALVVYAPPPMEYPYHMQTWRYPALGMSVDLWDRSLEHAYEIPYSDQPGKQPKPNLAAIAARGDLVVLGN